MDQMPLIPLTDEEIRARGQLLARMTLELVDLQTEHAEAKAEMAATEKDLKSRIRKLATSVRDGGYREE
jgi:hypothetical protein